MRLRKLTENGGLFPSNEALLNRLFLTLCNISKKWTRPIRDWTAASTRFAIQFGEQISNNTSDTPSYRKTLSCQQSPYCLVTLVIDCAAEGYDGFTVGRKLSALVVEAFQTNSCIQEAITAVFLERHILDVA